MTNRGFGLPSIKNLVPSRWFTRERTNGDENNGDDEDDIATVDLRDDDRGVWIRVDFSKSELLETIEDDLNEKGIEYRRYQRVECHLDPEDFNITEEDGELIESES